MNYCLVRESVISVNKVILVGRLTKDPELRSTASGVMVAGFTIACDRRYVKQGEEKKADFINCIAWRASAELISRHFKKGDRIALEGTLQVRDWVDGDGKRRYTTEVVVGEWEFAQSKSCGSASAQAEYEDVVDGFIPIDEEDLPF